VGSVQCGGKGRWGCRKGSGKGAVKLQVAGGGGRWCGVQVAVGGGRVEVQVNQGGMRVGRQQVRRKCSAGKRWW